MTAVRNNVCAVRHNVCAVRNNMCAVINIVCVIINTVCAVRNNVCAVKNVCAVRNSICVQLGITCVQLGICGCLLHDFQFYQSSDTTHFNIYDYRTQTEPSIMLCLCNQVNVYSILENTFILFLVGNSI